MTALGYNPIHVDRRRVSMRGSRHRRRHFLPAIRGTACLLLLLLLAAGWPAGAEAALLTVTDCGDNGGANQVRQVVAGAQAGDTVLLPPCSIVLKATLTLTRNIGLSGAGAGVTVLSGGHIVTVLVVAIGTTANLTGLSIQDGAGASGAGIVNFGTAVLTSAVVSGNSATTHAG